MAKIMKACAMTAQIKQSKILGKDTAKRLEEKDVKRRRMNWIEKQFEWIKGFFDEDDKADWHDAYGHNPSHKNLIGIAMIVIFAITYLKKIAAVDEIPDIPPGWQLVILGILGIRALQSGASAYIKSKNGNGNGSTLPPNGDPNVQNQTR